MANVLVTGANGFIGAHLCRALVSRGDRVRCLVRRTSRLDRLAGVDFEARHGDLDDGDSLASAMAGCEVVFHLAGITKCLAAADYFRVNAVGTANVASACARQTTPPRLVLISSQAAAGPSSQTRPRTEGEPANPVSAYGRSKLAAEQAAARCAGQVPITVIRPPIVFGPMDPTSFRMFWSVSRCHLHLCPTLARSRFSVIHVADLVELMLLAAQRGRTLAPGDGEASSGQGIYFAAAERDPTYFDLGHMLADAMGCRRVMYLPIASPLVWVVAAIGEGTGRCLRSAMYLNLDKAAEITAGSWVCSAEAAQRELGFQVCKALHVRVRETADWFRQAGWI